MQTKYNVTVTFTYTNFPAENTEAAQKAAHRFWGAGMHPEDYKCEVTVASTKEQLEQELKSAQKDLWHAMDDIRANFIGGLTMLTEGQKILLDNLEQRVNEASDLLMSHPLPIVGTFTKEI